MKKTLIIIAFTAIFVACSKDDEEINYLTSLENAKYGIKGIWERKEKYKSEPFSSIFRHTFSDATYQTYSSQTEFTYTSTYNIVKNDDAYILISYFTYDTIYRLTSKKLLIKNHEYYNVEKW